MRNQISARIGDLDPYSSLGQKWEELVQSSSHSGIMQSLFWQKLKRRQRLESYHVCLYQDEELIGGAIFYTPRNGSGARILIAPEGPVIAWDNEEIAAAALRSIIDCIENCATTIGAITVRIEPRVAPPPHRILREFVRAPIDLVPNETLYMDLSRSPEQILNEMKPKGRYNVRLSERHNVRVRESHRATEVGRLYSVLEDARDRGGFNLESFEFFQILCEELCESGHGHLLFAEHESDLLGAMLLITYGNRATYLYGGTTGTKRNLMGGYALQWNAMQLAKQKGCDLYDFYGYDPFRSPEHMYAKFSQFKSQFGGRVERFIGAYDYFLMDSLADLFIKAANEISTANVMKAISDARPREASTSPCK